MAYTKAYLKGNAKAGKYNEIRVSVNLDNLKSYAKDGWVNFFVSPRKETDQYGNTHSCYVLEGDADQQASKPAKKASAKQTSFDDIDDDLPF